VYDGNSPQGLNRYSYALNNPIIYRDPTGHQSFEDHPAVQAFTRWYESHPEERVGFIDPSPFTPLSVLAEHPETLPRTLLDPSKLQMQLFFMSDVQGISLDTYTIEELDRIYVKEITDYAKMSALLLPAIQIGSTLGSSRQPETVLEPSAEAPKGGKASPKKTTGVLIPKKPEGEPIFLESGNKLGARYPYSLADGHVETKGALIMQEEGITDAVLYHDNINGTCPNCDRYLPTYLEEGSTLTVVPPEDATPKTPRWQAAPKTYTGNDKSPY
jgi:hypothetical protein